MAQLAERNQKATGLNPRHWKIAAVKEAVNNDNCLHGIPIILLLVQTKLDYLHANEGL